MQTVDKSRMASLVELWEGLSHFKLSRRVVEFVRARKNRGDASAYARPAHYLAAAQTGSSATSATYILELDRGVRCFVAHTLELPDTVANSPTITALKKAGKNHVDADALGEGFMSVETDLDEDTQLPHPLVIDVGGKLTIEANGTALRTTASAIAGIQVHGYHVDDVTAQVLVEAGELWVEGLVQTFAAGTTIITKNTSRSVRQPKRQTHLLAKETLAGDAVRGNVSIQIKGERILPREGAVIPPRSTFKGGSLLDVDYVANDSIVVDSRYTSAGAGGSASLNLTFIGRRRFTDGA